MSRPTIEERLFAKREIDPEAGCWNWTGDDRLPKGYGRIHFEGKKRLVHRVAAHLWLGLPLDGPRDVQVLHHCDNKRCFNPKDLYIGTHDDNFRDAVERDRINFGERQWKAKLTEAQVKEIVTFAQSHSGKETAERFGLSKQHVSRLVNKKNWRRLWA